MMSASVACAAPMMTEWGEKVTPENALNEYPRPQLERATKWSNLNGLWDWQVTKRKDGSPEKWEKGILVPFAIETSLSRVGRLLKPNETLWYRRTFEAPALAANERLLLNFECVDWRTQIWINGVELTDYPHDGGQLPFSFDITALVKIGANELKLSVWDPTEGFITSHGKQLLKPHGCLYTRSSGIVGTVWTEVVPVTHLTGYRIVSDVAAGAVTVKFEGTGNLMGAKGRVKVLKDGKEVASAEMRDWTKGVRIELPRPVRLWTPETPELYDLELVLEDALAGTRDTVKGYFGMRSFEMKRDSAGVLRFFLNGKLTFVNGTLDQGWWPDGFLTPPSEEAMKFDITLLKSFGYNAMRKHIKVEPRRYYALCDRLGIMVLQDLPSGFNDPQNRYAFSRYELKGMIDHLYNHPSIVMWIPYNEGWGQPDAAKTRDTLLWTMRYDTTRLVDGPSGWHDYEGGQLMQKNKRVNTEHLKFGAPAAGHCVDMHDYGGSPSMYPPNPYRASFLGEYGGCSLKVPGHRWQEDAKEFSYGNSADRKALEKRYVGLMEKIAALAKKGLAGAIYTQTTDVENELNGLVTYDRKVVKFDAAVMRKAHQKIYDAVVASEYVRLEIDSSSLPTDKRFIGEIALSRAKERTVFSADGKALVVSLALDPSLEGERYAIKVADGKASVKAGRLRGLFVGLGSLLRAIEWKGRSFAVADFERSGCPEKPIRCAYYARHFYNWYHMASEEELTRLTEDLALWGVNALTYQFSYPVVDLKCAKDGDVERFERVSKALAKNLERMDMDLFVGGGGNKAPHSTDPKFRAAPNTDPKRGNFGFNVCPAKPGALELLVNQQKRVLEKYDGFKIGQFGHWPYDEGGCECEVCRPWGGKGYLNLCKDLSALNKAKHPEAQTCLSTWTFHDDEFQMLWDYLGTEDSKWIDVLLIDSHGDFPKYPLTHKLPRKVPIITFPEISMWGREPWGGFGAIAMPERYERLFRQCESVVSGFKFYSEGLSEDINKVVVTQLYVDPKRHWQDIVREYCRWEFPGMDTEKFIELLVCLEKTQVLPNFKKGTTQTFNVGRGDIPHFEDFEVRCKFCLEEAKKAEALSAELEKSLPEARRNYWRWRHLRLRTIIDKEIFTARDWHTPKADECYRELLKMYRSERAYAHVRPPIRAN